VCLSYIMNRPKTDAEIEELIAELREYTYTGYYSWGVTSMHFLVGFVIIVTLVAIGFGGNVAQSFVRGTIYVAGFALFAFIVWLAADTWDALRPMQSRTQATGYAIDTYFPPTPRCGAACETSHSGMPRACWEFFDTGVPATQACKDALNEEKRASK
jgi:hypothetical protein